jgi:hypothetical protein
MTVHSPIPDPLIAGVWHFESPEHTHIWLEENFPVNMARQRLIQEGRHMNTTKEARRDAHEFARAQMYYGEGAGTRRKLIEATVDAKTRRNPTYGQAFHIALADQDMAEHAEKARKERERTDRHEAVRRNTRAILTGRNQNAQTGILVLILVGTIAHRTGLDKKAYEKGKVLYADAKLRLKKYRQKLHAVN